MLTEATDLDFALASIDVYLGPNVRAITFGGHWTRSDTYFQETIGVSRTNCEGVRVIDLDLNQHRPLKIFATQVPPISRRRWKCSNGAFNMHTVPSFLLHGALNSLHHQQTYGYDSILLMNYKVCFSSSARLFFTIPTTNSGI